MSAPKCITCALAHLVCFFFMGCVWQMSVRTLNSARQLRRRACVVRAKLHTHTRTREHTIVCVFIELHRLRWKGLCWLSMRIVAHKRVLIVRESMRTKRDSSVRFLGAHDHHGFRAISGQIWFTYVAGWIPPTNKHTHTEKKRHQTRVHVCTWN